MPPSTRELERSLEQCLLDRLRVIHERLPRAAHLADVFDDPDALDHIPSSAELARAVGWIEGAADALDLTTLELLDAADIDLGAVS